MLVQAINNSFIVDSLLITISRPRMVCKSSQIVRIKWFSGIRHYASEGSQELRTSWRSEDTSLAVELVPFCNHILLTQTNKIHLVLRNPTVV
jgi:hypothetical protein